MTLKLTVMTRTGIVERELTASEIDFLASMGDEIARREKLKQALSEPKDDSEKLQLVINHILGE